MFEHHTLQTTGHTLSFVRGPRSGRPLLLLHGVGRCWQDFLTMLPALVIRYEVVALDFRGHGQSGRANGQYLVTDYVSDAIDLLRSEFHEPAIVYGHSLGAMVAAQVAATAPSAVRGLVLEDPPFETVGDQIHTTPFLSLFQGMYALAGSQLPIAELAAQIAEIRIITPGRPRTIRLGDVRDPASLRFVAKCLAQVDPDVYAPIVAGRWLAGYERQRVLPNIACPTLLLQGDIKAGGMLADADGAEAAALIPDCLHVRLPGVSHLIHSTAMERTCELLIPFCESLP